MSAKIDKRAFDVKMKQIKKVLQQFPRLAGEEAVKYFKLNFDKGGFLAGDGVVEKWKPRAINNAWKKKDDDPGRALLIGKGSGRLRDSIRVVSQTSNKIVIGTDVPYAKVHNEGSKKRVLQSVKPFHRFRNGKREQVQAFSRKITQNIPQRKFIGYSKGLELRLNRQLQSLVKQHVK
jgi:phage gpG-like protein